MPTDAPSDSIDDKDEVAWGKVEPQVGLAEPQNERNTDVIREKLGLKWHAGFSPIRLKRFPIEGEVLPSVRHLDDLVSHLSDAEQAEAGRQFNATLRSIDTMSPERFEASINRIIAESRDLPANHRAALMFNVMMVAHGWLGREQFQHAGFDGTLFERVKHKCAMAGLAKADEIPVGLALRFLEFATWSQLALNTDDDPNWPAQRRLKATLWLTQVEKVRRVIDPNWDESDRQMAERYNEQPLARRLLAELAPRMEEDLIRLYARKPINAAQVEMLLTQYSTDAAQRERIAKTVRLFNLIVPGGTRLKYGWPDGLAEAGPAGVDQLMVAVQDKTYPKFIRFDGAWALGLIGDPRALSVLKEVAADETTPAKYIDISREFVRVLQENADAPTGKAAGQSTCVGNHCR